MSRANPIALRIASKTQSSMFIGVGRYYFYDHLKQNLNILKLTELVSKQTVLPTNKVLKYKANSDNLAVLTPHLLPINTTCTAKQLFSTKYRLNKRRFSSAVLHYVCWLQDDFNTNYKRFNFGTDFVKYNKPYKLENQSIVPIYVEGRQSKKKDTRFYHITKANQISDISKYFVLNRSNNSILPYKEPSDNFINCLISLSSLALKRGVQPFVKAKATKKSKKSKISTQTKQTSLFYSKLLYMQNFKKMQILMGNYLTLPKNFNAPKDYSYSPILQKVNELCCFRSNYKDITNNMLLLAFLNLLYSQNKNFKYYFPKQVSLTSQLSDRQQKGVLNTEKSTQFPNLNSYVDSTIYNSLLTKYRYILSAYSGSKKANNLNLSKVQKHINSFSNTIKPIIPLELIIYRSFCEPAGLNYFTALDNRLSKNCFNINFSNTLFRRTSNNGFIPNYTNTQTGLIRLKAQIIFEFLYTLNNKGKSVIEQNSFLKNHQSMLDSKNPKLWLRKGSSVRL
uniref:Uncharacterized protein n=1 Tax=Ulva sp. UNA00071828 TaxID=1641711 RepID=A0A0F6ZCX9_9CHLO|nr:hypothetical protein [Ulva sp. UNA00071828]